jgi:predicted metal-binding membrane protein
MRALIEGSTAGPDLGRAGAGGRPRWLFAGAGLAMFASAGVAVIHRASTPAMEGMPMHGQPWPEAACFLGMWLPMMLAMMLPSVLPALWRYHQAVLRADAAHPAGLALLAGLAYFAVWMLVGLAACPLGIALAAVSLRVPAHVLALATGAIVLLAGLQQFTACKARLLACCRAAPSDGPVRSGSAAALRHGLRLGLHCSGCCAGATAVLLVTGSMNLPAMILATAAITAERLAPAGTTVMRMIGGVAIVAGAVLMLRA